MVLQQPFLLCCRGNFPFGGNGALAAAGLPKEKQGAFAPCSVFPDPRSRDQYTAADTTQ